MLLRKPEPTAMMSENCDDCRDVQRALLAAISRAHNQFLTETEPKEIFEGLLDALLATTGSEYGFIGEAHVDDTGAPYLKTHAITNIAWNEETRRFFEEKAPAGLEFRNLNTLFGQVLATRAPVVANDPANDPRRGGLPPGHPPLNRFLGLPFFSRGELVGTVGIANRPGGYDQGVIDFLGPLTATCANIIGALRSERSRLLHAEQLGMANEALRQQVESRERAEGTLAKFFDLSLELLCIADEEGRFLHLNPAWTEVLGYSLAELQSKPFVDFVHPDDRDATAGEAARLLETGGRTVSFENRYLCRDGSMRWLRWTAASDEGRIYGAARDITEQKRNDAAASARLAELEERASQMSLLSEMGELLQSCSSFADVSKVVGAFMGRMFALDTGAIYALNGERSVCEAIALWGDDIDNVVPPNSCWALRRGRVHRVSEDAPSISCDHHRIEGAYLCVPLMAQGEAKGFLHVRFAPGQSSALRRAKDQLAMAAGDQIGLAIANIALRQTLEEQSTRDALTGLYNRRYMEETLERETRRAVRGNLPLAVVMLDLDHFKRFNDTYGHIAADELLRDFGGLLGRFFRREDVVCRFGGEEFVVLLPGASVELAVKRMEDLRNAMRSEAVGHPSRADVSFSCGVAAYPSHGSRSETLLRAADAAMYRAKSEGRDRIEKAYVKESREGAVASGAPPHQPGMTARSMSSEDCHLQDHPPSV